MGSGSQPARLAASLAVTFLCVACGQGTSADGHASASCVAPYLNDQPPSGPYQGPTPTVAPGDSLTVYGHWYTTTCNDTGGNQHRLVPMAPVHLTLTLPDGSTEDLGRFTPGGADMGFSDAVQVWAGSPAGLAVIRDDQQHPAMFRFKVAK